MIPTRTLQPATDDADPKATTARLELANACLQVASNLTALAAALVGQVERDAQRDVAASVDRWLATLAERARRVSS